MIILVLVSIGYTMPYIIRVLPTKSNSKHHGVAHIRVLWLFCSCMYIRLLYSCHYHTHMYKYVASGNIIFIRVLPTNSKYHRVAHIRVLWLLCSCTLLYRGPTTSFPPTHVISSHICVATANHTLINQHAASFPGLPCASTRLNSTCACAITFSLLMVVVICH